MNLIAVKSPFSIAALFALISCLTGCGGGLAALQMLPALAGQAAAQGQMNSYQAQAAQMKADSDLVQERSRIMRKFNGNPDSDSWYDQRQKISQTMGDRVFDHEFGRVFDSLSIATAALEIRVTTMERTSGHIAAQGIALPPTETRAMRSEAVNDWLRQNKVNPAIFTREIKDPTMRNVDSAMDMTDMLAKYEKMSKGLTFQLVKLGDKQTKVKLRFFDVYYPGELEALYKIAWQSVDKQIFVDQTIEGKVEARK